MPAKKSQDACSEPTLWPSCQRGGVSEEPFHPAEHGWAGLRAESWEQKSSQEAEAANSGCRAGLTKRWSYCAKCPEVEHLKT